MIGVADKKVSYSQKAEKNVAKHDWPTSVIWYHGREKYLLKYLVAQHVYLFLFTVAPKKPESLRVLEVTSTTFTLDVEEPDDDGGLRVEGYQVGYHIEGFWEEYQDFNGK